MPTLKCVYEEKYLTVTSISAHTLIENKINTHGFNILVTGI